MNGSQEGRNEDSRPPGGLRKDNHMSTRSWLKLCTFLIALCLGMATVPGFAQVSRQVEVAASEPGRETAAFNLHTEACIYGYPLVIMEILRSVMTNVAAPEGFHAPLGQFAHVRQYPDASFKGARFPTGTSSIPSPGWTSRRSLTS